ncbi:MAG: hypothetical protein V3V08_04615 [Nannocystaceae bacterium]
MTQVSNTISTVAGLLRGLDMWFLITATNAAMLVVVVGTIFLVVRRRNAQLIREVAQGYATATVPGTGTAGFGILRPQQNAQHPVTVPTPGMFPHVAGPGQVWDPQRRGGVSWVAITLGVVAVASMGFAGWQYVRHQSERRLIPTPTIEQAVVVPLAPTRPPAPGTPGTTTPRSALPQAAAKGHGARP